jgi:hypothetical protein
LCNHRFASRFSATGRKKVPYAAQAQAA